MMTPLETTLEARINMAKLPLNSRLNFKLDKKQNWLKDILLEMNENAKDRTPEEWLNETEITLELELMKCFKGEIGEYLLVTGHLEASYATECVRTLKPMKENLTADFKSCFAPEALLSSEEYAETGEIWTDNHTWELYGYERHHVELFEMVREQAYLNYNYYPRIDADGPLNLDFPGDKSRQ